MTSPLLGTRMVDTAAGRVRVAELGPADAVPLVFVHGYPDNLQIWARVMQLLGEQRRVIAFDWPGLGHSDAITAGATPFHLGRHFVSVLDALAVERAIPVGFDMGGHAVVAAATTAPERVERLVLTNFLADGTVETSWDISVMRRLGLNGPILQRGARIVFERAQRTFLQKPGDLDAAVRLDLWEGFGRREVRDRLAKMCAGYEASLPRVARLYPDIAAQTLVLWADRDRHFPPAQGEAVANAIPDSTLRILEGASHWFMWERADDVAAILAEF